MSHGWLRVESAPDMTVKTVDKFEYYLVNMTAGGSCHV